MALFTGSGALVMLGGDTRIYDVQFENGPLCLDFSPTRGFVENCYFSGTTGIDINGDWANISRCHFDGLTTAILSDASNVLNISENWFDSGTEGIQGFLDNGSVVANNRFINLDVGINLDQGADLTTIEGNTMIVTRGIYLSGGNDCNIQDNVISADEDGIVADDTAASSANCTISGNTVKMFSSGAHDGIQVDGVDDFKITDNKVIPVSTPRNGINVVSGNDNVVFANALGDASNYTGADFADGGTATDTAPGSNGQFSY